MKASINKTKSLIIFFTLGLVATFLPLIGDFYLETAQVCSVLFSFFTIWMVSDGVDNPSITSHQSIQSSHFKYLGSIYFKMGVFLFPILISALIRGCFNLDGLIFVLLIPSVGILFVYSLLLLVRTHSRLYKLWTILFVLFIVAILPLVILKNVPHVFMFNPIWGWFPGPIYDEQIIFSFSLVYHSFFVLTLSLMFLFVNHVVLNIHFIKRAVLIAFTGVVLIAFLYNWSNLGLGYSLKTIENELGGVAESEHFVLIYDEDVLSEEDVKYWLFWHEFHFYDLSKQLDLDLNDFKITSVLYRDVWQKLEYTGAKFTSYVPVWNDTPQLHLDIQTAEFLLRHELVHVLTKDISNSFIGANLKIGLTEGIAVALEDPRSVRFTRDEILINSELDIRVDLIDETFSILGFYGGRSSINYSVSGSFVSYLLQNHELDDFKCVYGGSAFVDCFSSFDEIKYQWVDYVKSIPPDTTVTLYARNYISRESIFEKKCARFVSETEKQYDIFRMKFYRKDFSGAYEELLSLNQRHPESATIWMNMTEMGIHLNEYVPDFTFESTHSITDSITVLFRQADLAIVREDIKRAEQLVLRLDSIHSLNPTFESFFTLQFALRGITTDFHIRDGRSVHFWKKYAEIRYKNGEIQDNDSILHKNLWLSLKSSRNEKLHFNEISKVFTGNHYELNESNIHYLIWNLISLDLTEEYDIYLFELLDILNQNAQTNQNSKVLEMYDRAINFSESYH